MNGLTTKCVLFGETKLTPGIVGLLNCDLDVGNAGASRDFNFHPNRVSHGPSPSPVASVSCCCS